MSTWLMGKGLPGKETFWILFVLGFGWLLSIYLVDQWHFAVSLIAAVYSHSSDYFLRSTMQSFLRVQNGRL